MGNPDQEQSSLLIDANVILEFLLGQPRQDESLSLLKLTSNGSVTAWVMSYAVHSIEYILYREGNLTALRNFLELLQSSVADFSVVLFRLDCVLVSEKNYMKVHKNQWIVLCHVLPNA